MNRAQSGVGTRGPGRQEPALLSRSSQTCKEAVTVPRWAPRCILTADGGACGCTCGREGRSVGPEKQGPRPPPPAAGVGAGQGRRELQSLAFLNPHAQDLGHVSLWP